MSFPENILSPLIEVANAILRFFHDLGLSWGAAIIGLTVVVRLVILPLTFKQVRSMQAMQRLQPEIKRLQERYRDDRQRLQQEMMGFYKEHQVNPFGSCLPLVLQLPFFISLFYLLQGEAFKHEIRGEESFLFIPDLAAPVSDPVVLGVLIVLFIATQLGSTLVTAISADKNQRRLFLALPFVFVIFIIQFQAGLIVYWITTNVWTIGQQLAVKKFLPTPEPIEARTDASDEPARGKPARATEAPSGDAAGRKPSLFGRITDAVAAAGEEKPADSSAGSPAKAKGGTSTKAKSGASASAENGRPQKAPPPPPRKKKKRTGRRR